MNFKLRPWRKDDLDSLVKHANNANIARNITDRFPHPYTLEAGEQFIELTTSPENLDRFRVIEVDGEFAGGIGIHPHDDIFRLNAEIAYWLTEPLWNKGIITKAIQEMIHYGFTHFGVTRIFGTVLGSNLGSQRVLEKAGFTLENKISDSIIKYEKVEDCLIYGIRNV
ncbi:MAG: GNAT family N-acetyltransferase [Bacteroidetes bacterium]|nr:MAG: GNAT family N-acetyltransferase [Bacteroidota bacterium]